MFLKIIEVDIGNNSPTKKLSNNGVINGEIIIEVTTIANDNSLSPFNNLVKKGATIADGVREANTMPYIN